GDQREAAGLGVVLDDHLAAVVLDRVEPAAQAGRDVVGRHRRGELQLEGLAGGERPLHRAVEAVQVHEGDGLRRGGRGLGRRRSRGRSSRRIGRRGGTAGQQRGGGGQQG